MTVRPILIELGVGVEEYPACHLTSNHLRWATKVKWEDIRNQMQQKSVHSGWTKLKYPPDGSDETFISSAYMVTFIPKHDKWYALDYEQVMMIVDTLSSRFFTLLYMDFLLDGTPGKISSEFSINLYEVFDHLENRGNQAYESISYWESVVLAAILQTYSLDPLEEAQFFEGLFLNPVNSTQITTQSDLLELYRRVISKYGILTEIGIRY